MIYLNFIQQDERGVSIFELAIVVPFLLVLIFGSLEIAMKVNSIQLVSAAAQEGVKVAATYKLPPAMGVVCPSTNTAVIPNPVKVTCSSGGVENIPSNADIGRIARISSCNYLKQQDLDAAKWEVSTVVRYKKYEDKKFPIIELSIKEKNPTCKICVAKMVSIIPSDSNAQMSLQDCPVV